MQSHLKFPAFVSLTPLQSISRSSFSSSRCDLSTNPTVRAASRRCFNQKFSPPVTMVSSQQETATAASSGATDKVPLADIGLYGLAVMGQNLALNIAEKGFTIAVHNRSTSKVTDTVERAERENLSSRLFGYEDVKDFINGLSRPRKIILLVKAGAPVDATIETLKSLLEEGDLIIDGGNEYYTNTERRATELAKHGIMYMGMGVSGGEEGARNGPSLMPGGPAEGWELIRPMMEKVSAQVDDGPCVTHIGPRGAGNYVKMVHNGIEYGDMQLIGEAYDLLRNVAGISMSQIADVFDEWNNAELQSFLIEITAKILRQKDDLAGDSSYLVDKVLDQTGSKGTGMWTIQEAAAKGIPAPTIAAALDARYISSLKEDRKLAVPVLKGPSTSELKDSSEQKKVVEDIRKALYASKICSYAQGMNLIRTAGIEGDWNLNLGEIARIWKGGCIIRAKFLDRIKAAYDRDAKLPSLLLDDEFADELNAAQESWRRVSILAIQNGVAIPATAGSLAYYDNFRREVLISAQMVQAQRDFFGSHTYKRLDKEGVYHTRWSSDGVSVKQD